MSHVLEYYALLFNPGPVRDDGVVEVIEVGARTFHLVLRLVVLMSANFLVTHAIGPDLTIESLDIAVVEGADGLVSVEGGRAHVDRHVEPEGVVTGEPGQAALVDETLTMVVDRAHLRERRVEEVELVAHAEPSDGVLQHEARLEADPLVCVRLCKLLIEYVDHVDFDLDVPVVALRTVLL